MFHKVLLYTNICVRYVTETVLKYHSPVIEVFLTFNPLFDANILNHINDMISSLILYNKMLSENVYNYITLATGN